MNDNRKPSSPWLIIGILVFINLVVFAGLGSAGFVNYDDPSYVTQNPMISQGITLQSLHRAFTDDLVSLWIPLTSISMMADCQIFGLKAGPMHWMNLALHIANTILLLLVVLRAFEVGPAMSQVKAKSRLLIAGFVALAFAVHPMHVEPVAWISSRKDVLSTLFWLLCTWSYLRFVASRKPADYAAALVLFCLGLMSKPSLIPLPFTLLLLDIWPLERIDPGKLLQTVKRPVAEKLLFFVAAGGVSIATFLVQAHTGAAKSNVIAYTPWVRLKSIFAAYGMFLYKSIVPTNLTCAYPHPAVMGRSFPPGLVVLGVVAVVGLTVGACLQLKKRPYLAVGWFWFMGTLFPVCGIIPIGSHFMADRYSYVSFIGLFLGGSFAVYRLWESHNWNANVLAGIAVIVAIVWMALARQQAATWKDSEHLWLHAISVDPDNFIARNQLATYYGDGGHYKEALPHFKKAIELNPERPELYANCANALSRVGKAHEAEDYYRQALERAPENFDSLTGLGRNLIEQKRGEEAIRYLIPALKQQPESLEVLNSIAAAYAQIGQASKAAEYLRNAIRLHPGDPIATRNLQKIEAFLRARTPY